MQRLTVQRLIDEGVPALVNMCEDDPRFYALINTFQERALNYGRWWGTTQLAQFCVQVSCGQACIVLPREVALIEAMGLNGARTNVQNLWGQFVRPHVPSACGCSNSDGTPCVGNGGSRCGCGCGCGPVQLQDEGMVASFGVTAEGDRIRFYPTNASDVGKKIIVQGYNASNVWVRTSIDGVVQDGEQVTLALPYTTTLNTWAVGSPTGIIKAVTNYRVLAFAVNTDDEERAIADYQPGETNPSYRKQRVVSGWARAACGATSSTLRAIVSLQHVPVRIPNDSLLFTNIAAYEDGVQAVRYWREGDRALGDAYFFGRDDVPRNARGVLRAVKLSGAIPTLTAELRKQVGDVTSVSVRRDGVSLVGFV